MLLQQAVGEETLNERMPSWKRSSFPSGLMASKAFGGKLEEFRNRLDIPVGVADIDMAQVGGELRKFPPHVEARPVPFDEPTSRETVTKILKPWPTTNALTPVGTRRPME